MLCCLLLPCGGERGRVAAGEEDTFLSPLGSSSLSNRQIDVRQIDKRKVTKFNYTHIYGNPTNMRVRGPTDTRESETEKEHEIFRTVGARDEERPLGLQRGGRSIAGQCEGQMFRH